MDDDSQSDDRDFGLQELFQSEDYQADASTQHSDISCGADDTCPLRTKCIDSVCAMHPLEEACAAAEQIIIGSNFQKRSLQKDLTGKQVCVRSDDRELPIVLLEVKDSAYGWCDFTKIEDHKKDWTQKCFFQTGPGLNVSNPEKKTKDFS
jgi:hypothetical protein